MGRFFQAISRWFNHFFLRRSEEIRQAADEQFTGSTKGIQAAFEIEREKLASEFNDMQEAVAGVLNVMEEKKAQLEKLTEEEEKLKVQVQGALAAAEKAEPESDDYVKAKSAFQRYSRRLTEIDDLEARLTASVADLDKGIETHMLRLTEMQARLEELPQKEAEAIAEFVSAQKIVELNNRMMNAQDSLNDSPVGAVMEKVRNLSAQARISEKLAGSDVKLQDRDYEMLGQQSETEGAFEVMLAARKAKKADAEAIEEEEEAVVAEEAERQRPEL